MKHFKKQNKLWWIFYILGTYFTFSNVYSNYCKYVRYGSIITTSKHETNPAKIFPKITLCPNSMHSRMKIMDNYSYLNMTLLQVIYGGCKEDCETNVNKYNMHPTAKPISDYPSIWLGDCSETE